MRRALTTFVLGSLAALLFVSPAAAAFGFKALDTTFTNANGSPAMQAGSHPFAFTTFFEPNARLNEEGNEVPDEEFKDLLVNLPAGLVGTPDPVPRCSSADFLFIDQAHPFSNCPDSSAVGTIEVAASVSPIDPVDEKDRFFEALPVYNLTPPPGVAAKVGFVFPPGLPVTIELGVNPNPPYNLQAHVTNIPQAALFFGSRLTVWGVPASPLHDGERGKCVVSHGNCSVSLPEVPYLTMPRSCTGPLTTGFEAVSWQHPDAVPVKAETSTHDNSIPPEPLGVFGCEKLGFAPSIAAKPTTDNAESPSGLDFNLDVEDTGLTNPTGDAQSDIKKAVVTMPPGVTVNPSVAEGLVTCSEAGFGSESVDSEPGVGCPQASKIGNVEVETPLLQGTLLKGSIFVATQEDNPFDSLIALYMVIKDPKLGILVKLPGRVEPDPKTGQLITTFGEPGYEIPQFPFSHFRFHFREGGRSPLVTPPTCDTYTTTAALTPWADPTSTLTTAASFKISKGVNGGPCPPAGVPPFHPGFEAGTNNNDAGSYSPFYMRLTRADGEQDMTRFDSVLPPGVVGKIAGLAKCPDAAIASAKAKTGRQELAAPSCPASSQIGRTLAGAGVGSSLTYVPGKVYLGGPLAGDPLSVIAITPAVAGPFDAGTVVVREALTLDPNTAEVQVDGANSDPIPHILKGIPLKLRDLRIYVDRPNFTLNATSCNEETTKATLFGGFADVFSPADDVPVSLSARYQAASCLNLGFKPNLSLKLVGGTKRGDHPALKSVLTYPPGPGYANISRAVVTLPPSEFIDNAHIQNPCTRVQFNEGKCPKGSLLGTAKATTPLLDEPLEGPVYFRSNGGERLLPDVVADLGGLFHIILVGHVDSKNARVRTTFENVPDAPVLKFTLNLNGGKKGLLVNNRSLCANKPRAMIKLTAQNSKTYDTKPVVGTSCKKSSGSRKTTHRAP